MQSTEGKVIKCLAAVTWNVKDPFVIEEIEVYPPEAGEVRIKIEMAAICHTDLHAMEGNIIDPKYPTVLGHESAGIVESIGSGVTTVKPGDKVIPVFIPQCYDCKSCQHPDTNLCEKYQLTWMNYEKSRMKCKGETLYHFMRTSSFSQYTVTDEIHVVKVSDSAPLDKVCLLGCGISTGYGAALNTAKVTKGSSCAVFGLGSIGLSAVMGCKASEAEKIYGIDTNPDKEKAGKLFGVTDFINPNDYEKPISDVLMEKTGGLGCDFTFEAIGIPAVMREAFNSCCIRWGKCTILGVAPVGKNVELNALEFLAGKTVTGSLFGDWKPRSSIPSLVEDYLAKKIKLDEFVSCEKPLKEINEGMQLLREGNVLRVVIDFWK